MPNPVIILTFVDSSGGAQYSYQIYSSEQEDRPIHRLRRDVLYQIGYQESYPNDRTTLEGYLDAITEVSCSVLLAARDQAMHCVVNYNQSIDPGYEPIEINDVYANPVTDGTVITAPHFTIQPNLTLDIINAELDAAAEASDSDSD